MSCLSFIATYNIEAGMRFKPCLDQVNSEGLPWGRCSPDAAGRILDRDGPGPHMHAWTLESSE